jgi:hypothetical protein
MGEAPFPIRPLNVSAVMENGFKTFRARWKDFLVLGLLGVGVPMAAIYACAFWFLSRFFSGFFSLFGAVAGGDSSDLVLRQWEEGMTGFMRSPGYWIAYGAMILIGLAFSFFVYPIVFGAVAKLTAAHYEGGWLTAREAFAWARARAGKLIRTMLASTVIVFGLVLAFILLLFGLIFLMAVFQAWILILPVLLLFLGYFLLVFLLNAYVEFALTVPAFEDAGGFRACGRAFKLMRKKFWFVVGANLLPMLIVSFAGGTVMSLFTLLLFVPGGFVVAAIVSAAVMAALMPFPIIACALAYIRLKVEYEAYAIPLTDA